MTYKETLNEEYILKTEGIKEWAVKYTGTHDPLYYARLEAELDHLFYRYEIGIIKSERQLILASDECISMIHILPNNNKPIVNVYQRSCNMANVGEDVGFICDYFQTKFKDNHDLSINYKFGSLHSYD